MPSGRSTRTTGRIHLNNADVALLAQPTLDAMTAQLRREAEIGGYEAAAEARDAITATYDAIARLIGGLGERSLGQLAMGGQPGVVLAAPDRYGRDLLG